MTALKYRMTTTGTDPKEITKAQHEADVQAPLDALAALISSAVTDLEFNGPWDASAGSFPSNVSSI